MKALAEQGVIPHIKHYAVNDQENGRNYRVWQAIVPAGGLSGRRFRYATNFSGFAA